MIERPSYVLTLADPIVHQVQPTPCSCTATCIAMAVGVPVAELGVDLARAYDFEDFGLWLATRGIWLRMLDRGERWWDGHLYLVGVRSLNIVNSDHAVLVDTRGPRKIGEGYHERSHWRTFDPNKGREGKKTYEWVVEYLATDVWRFVQYDGRYMRAGLLPWEVKKVLDPEPAKVTPAPDQTSGTGKSPEPLFLTEPLLLTEQPPPYGTKRELTAHGFESADIGSRGGVNR